MRRPAKKKPRLASDFSPCLTTLNRGGARGGQKIASKMSPRLFFSQTPVRFFLVLRVVKGGVIHRYATKDTIKLKLLKGGAIELAGLHAQARSTQRRNFRKVGCRDFRTTLKKGCSRGGVQRKFHFCFHLPSRSAFSPAVCIPNVCCLVM